MRKQFSELEVNNLPSMPHVLLDALEICQTPGVTAKQIAESIALDAGLTARVISVSCNAIPLEHRKFSLIDIIEQLGVESVKRIITAAAFQFFFNPSSPAVHFFMSRFWQHSLTCAYAAQLIAENIANVDGEEAYFAGLLHDIGQLVYLQNFGAEYLNICRQTDEEEIEASEQVRFGLTHREIGAWYVGQWDLPGFTADSILYHHGVVDEIRDAHSLVKVTYLAEKIASSQLQFRKEAVRVGEVLFGFSSQYIEEIIDQTGEQLQQSASHLDINFDLDVATEDIATERDIDALDDKEAQPLFVIEYLKKRSLLALQLQGIGQMDGVVRQYARINQSDDALIEAIVQNGTVLFGFKSGNVFLYDEAENKVVGWGVKGKAEIQGLSIPLEPGRSLITDSIIENKIFYALLDDNNRLNVVDKQLIGLTGLEGMVCFPLVDRSNGPSKSLGVIIYGIEKTQTAEIERQRDLIESFANESSISLHQFYKKQKNEKQLLDQERAFYQSRLKSVAHEANNPLSIIQHYLQILAIKLDEDHTAQQELKIIREEIERAANIISGLTALESEKPKSITAVDVNRAIESIIAVFQASLFEENNIEALVDLDFDIPLLVVDINAVKQIITNLVKNSVEELAAMQSEALFEDGDSFFQSRISISTRDHVFINGVNCFEICVSDNGRGIPNTILETLFKPVKSKKGENHQGIGLSIVDELVNSLDGSIVCETNSAEGTTFRIFIERKVVKDSALERH